jgi:alpha-mannosidase
MTLTLEWRRRIDTWRDELRRFLFVELGEVPLTTFVTDEQLTCKEASQRNADPVSPGTAWGAKWEYGWFFGRFTLPPEAEGKRIVLCPDVGGESAVYLSGRAAGAVDAQHQEILLADPAETGMSFELAIEAYAGHGPRVTKTIPAAPGVASVPEPPAQQCVVGRTFYGIWREEAYQLAMDVETLYRLRDCLDPEELRVAEIDAGLRDFTTLVDWEQEPDAVMRGIKAARDRLAPLLEAVNGTTAPTLYCFGHSHIDVAWLWPLQETERKCTRTFATQLALMEQYPEFKFQASQPHLFRFVKRNDPELYARIVEATKRGQWVPEGGMWVEADTNVSGGEALIRQFVHGKRFFQDELGVDCELLWLPDVFGYSGALPQIMRGCGIRYFATAKIFWVPNGGTPFPHNTFEWRGIDGSSVLVHLMNDYNSHTDPASLIERWRQRVQKDGISARLVPFGYGDGGGGPTRNHLEFLRRMRDLQGVPRTRITTPNAFFHDLEREGVPDAHYVGELYYQAHRGTYTSQAKTKRGNRKGEIALREAEIWGVMASALGGFAYPTEAMDEAWKGLLLNQFHDILPGSSIERVYQEAEALHAEVIEQAGRVAADARRAMVDEGNAVTVFNSLSWTRDAIVELPKGMVAAETADGAPLLSQATPEGVYARVPVPSCGWTTVVPTRESPSSTPLEDVIATATTLENDLLRFTLDSRGQIISAWDKETDREWLTGPSNAFKMWCDLPAGWDAWDIDSNYPEFPVAVDDEAQVEVVSSGPLMGQLRITRMLNHSQLTQTATLVRGSRTLVFDSEIDWQETHKLLKVAFAVDMHAHEALHEIQFGHIARPNHKSRPFDADRFEVSNHRWTALTESNRGAAVLNDCKYGVNVDDNEIGLTLLKSATAPDMHADKGLQRFTYAFHCWNGSFDESNVVRQGYELNVPVSVQEGDGGSASLLQVDAPNVIVETVKPAEDGSGDVVVRLYEAKRAATRCELGTMLPVESVERTDMLENSLERVAIANGSIPLELRPFEIVTLRLHIADAEAR